MTARRQLVFCLGLLGAVTLLGGCRGGDSQLTPAEIDEPYYRQGQQQLKQERPQEALASFLKVIEKRGEQASAESHLEAGTIYLKHSKDPIEAYHHFRQYLAQQPNSRKAPLVAGLIDTAKKEFARTLPGQPLENQTGRAEFLDQIEKLQRENQDLRAELSALRTSAGNTVLRTVRAPASGELPAVRMNAPAPVPVATIEEESPITAAPALPRPPIADAPAVPAPNSPPSRGNLTSPGGRTAPVRPGTTTQAAPPPASGRRHIVAQGEGLFAIARKYYGTTSAAKAKGIYEANRDVMKNESDLRPGMELKIP